MMKTILCALAVMALIGVKGQSLTIDRATTFGGTNSDIATSISRTNDGGFIVAGYTQSNNLDVTGAISGEDAWILKLSSNGFLQWKKIVGGSGDDRAYDIVQTQNGDFVFAGTTNSETGDVTNPLGGFDAWMVRLNPNGVVVWSRNLGGSDDDAFYDVFEAPNGALAAVGESKSDIAGTLNRGGYDYYLSALNSNGSTLLQRQYGGSADDQARAASFSGGSVYIMGTTASDDGNVSDNKGGTDLWLVKTNATGNLQFEQSFGGSNNDVGSSLVISSNNLLMAGTTESDDQDLNSNNGGKDFFLVKFNTSNGQTSWARSYGSDGDEEAYSLIASSDGGAALIGYSDGNDQDVPANYGGRDQWLLNVNGSGNVTASQNFGGSANDEAYDILAVGGNAVVLAGYSESDDFDLNNNRGNADYWLSRVVLSGAASPLALAAQNEEISVQAFPNPVVDQLRLQSSETIEVVRLFDLTGKLVESHTVNSTDAIFSLNLPAGIYVMESMMENGQRLTQSLAVNK